MKMIYEPQEKKAEIGKSRMSLMQTVEASAIQGNEKISRD